MKRLAPSLALAVGITLAGSLALPDAAHAQVEPPDDFFLGPYQQIVTLADGWKGTLAVYAERLFILLATLQLVWTLYDGLLRQAYGVEQALERFVRQLFILLLLFNILLWAPGLGAAEGAGVILRSFSQIGADAAGIAGASPVGFFTLGFELVSVMIEKNGFLLGVLPGGGQKMMLVTGSIGIVFLCYFAISVYATFILIDAIFVVSVGFFMLAFSGSRFTVGIAQGYFTWLVRTGVKLLVLNLLLGLGWALTTSWRLQIEDFSLFEIKGYALIAAGATIYALMVLRFPSIAAGVIPTGQAFDLAYLYRD